MVGPGKSSAIDDGTTERRAVPAHEFGQRFDHDVGPVGDRAQQDGRRNGIVDHEWHAVPMGNLGQGLDIADVAGRIADALAEHGLRLTVDQPLDSLRRIGFGEAGRDPLPRQNMGEQRMSSAVELRHGHDVAAAVRKVGDRVIECRLPGADRQGRDAAFERRDALFEHRRCRITDPAIPVAFLLKVEQRRSMVRAVERISHGLIDRDRHGFRGRVLAESSVKRDGFVPHASTFVSIWIDPAPRSDRAGPFLYSLRQK